jgi:hypothetical protein
MGSGGEGPVFRWESCAAGSSSARSGSCLMPRAASNSPTGYDPSSEGGASPRGPFMLRRYGPTAASPSPGSGWRSSQVTGRRCGSPSGPATTSSGVFPGTNDGQPDLPIRVEGAPIADSARVNVVSLRSAGVSRTPGYARVVARISQPERRVRPVRPGLAVRGRSSAVPGGAGQDPDRRDRDRDTAGQGIDCADAAGSGAEHLEAVGGE